MNSIFSGIFSRANLKKYIYAAYKQLSTYFRALFSVLSFWLLYTGDGKKTNPEEDSCP